MTQDKQKAEPREMNDKDKVAMGLFITTCYNLNDSIDAAFSRYAQHGFESACDYLRSEEIKALEAKLSVAMEAIQKCRDESGQAWIQHITKEALKRIGEMG